MWQVLPSIGDKTPNFRFRGELYSLAGRYFPLYRWCTGWYVAELKGTTTMDEHSVHFSSYILKQFNLHLETLHVADNLWSQLNLLIACKSSYTL